MLGLGADATVGATLAGAGTGAIGAVDTETVGLAGGTVAVEDFASSAGALQTLDPKAGTAAGGDEARGAYLSLDASARLARRASLARSFPASRLAADGSTASDERREYKSACDPSRSDGDAWWAEWEVGPVGVPGT
jgi:hypothetical protein